MFLLLGGVLSGVIAVVGTLNFLNAILTGMIARRQGVCCAAVGWNDQTPAKADACV